MNYESRTSSLHQNTSHFLEKIFKHFLLQKKVHDNHPAKLCIIVVAGLLIYKRQMEFSVKKSYLCYVCIIDCI